MTVAETVEEELVRLRAEVERLQGIEVMFDILQGEMADLRRELSNARLKIGEFKDTFDGMVTDISLMEDQIRDLSGQEPGGTDYGP